MKNTLQDLKNILDNRQVVLARELTKIHEEFIYGTIDEIIEKADNLKGEMIILIEGISMTFSSAENELNSLSFDEHFEYYKNLGFDKKEIIKKIAKDRGLNKNKVYMKFLEK